MRTPRRSTRRSGAATGDHEEDSRRNESQHEVQPPEAPFADVGRDGIGAQPLAEICGATRIVGASFGSERSVDIAITRALDHAFND